MSDRDPPVVAEPILANVVLGVIGLSGDTASRPPGGSGADAG